MVGMAFSGDVGAERKREITSLHTFKLQHLYKVYEK
jgi:hypothetical protein